MSQCRGLHGGYFNQTIMFAFSKESIGIMIQPFIVLDNRQEPQVCRLKRRIRIQQKKWEELLASRLL